MSTILLQKRKHLPHPNSQNAFLQPCGRTASLSSLVVTQPANRLFHLLLHAVFFPRDQLPGFTRVISEFLPLIAAVELIRPLFMDPWPEHDLRHLAVLLVYAVGGFWVALTIKRFKS